MDNAKLDELERVARSCMQYEGKPLARGVATLYAVDLLALITAARRPTLPDREAVARLVDPWGWDPVWPSSWSPASFRREQSLTKADAILALFSLSPAQAEREGWVMVPREPTEAMILAGAYGRRNGWRESTKATYQGMLSAAPKVTTQAIATVGTRLIKSGCPFQQPPRRESR